MSFCSLCSQAPSLQPRGCLEKLLNSCRFKEKEPRLAVIGKTSHHTFPRWETARNFTLLPFPDHAGEGRTSQRHISVLPGGISTSQLQHSPAACDVLRPCGTNTTLSTSVLGAPFPKGGSSKAGQTAAGALSGSADKAPALHGAAARSPA